MPNPCRYSGTILGGYIEEHRDTTIDIMCIKCWRMVKAEPIPPEWRTDLRIDGAPVEVLCKQVVVHAFGTACSMYWRRDHHRWMGFIAGVLMLVSIFQFLYRLVSHH